MKKLAIFVEGQTELIAVREFLLHEFVYEISLECRTLFKVSELKKAGRDFSNPNARIHVQIINVGNDNAVLSRILAREKFMWAAGYERIVGLRDMYSRAYRELSSTVDTAINRQFIDGTNAMLQTKAKSPESIVVCFAIMEIEAWFLGMFEAFQKLDDLLTHENILRQLGIDLQQIDPETEFFHPAIQLDIIYQIANKSYDKHKGDIEAIASVLGKDDYKNLLKKDKCQSFNQFYDALALSEDESS